MPAHVPCQPLCRSESQQLTRQKLLVAARRLFAEHGYGGTSLEAVAREAGFSKGAVYSNFDSKEQMFLAVLQEHRDETHLSLLAILDAEPPIPELLQRIGDWGDNCAQGGIWGYLALEYARHVKHDPALKALQSNLLQESWARIGTRLARYLRPEANIDPYHLGTLLLDLAHAPLSGIASSPTIGELLQLTMRSLLQAYGHEQPDPALALDKK